MNKKFETENTDALFYLTYLSTFEGVVTIVNEGNLFTIRIDDDNHQVKYINQAKTILELLVRAYHTLSVK